MAEYPRGGSLCPRRGGEVNMTYLVVRHARACSAVRSPPLVEDVGGRGGRLSPQDLTVTSRPPLETRGQCTWGRAPAYTVPHASRGLWLERDRKRVPQAGARLPREERERGTSLVSRHAGACTAVQKFSQPLEWLRSRPLPGRERVVDVGAEEGGVAEGRVVVGHAGGGGVGEQQGGRNA